MDAGRNSGVPQGPPGQPRLPTTGPPPPMPVPKEDFDFTAALEKFNKEEISKNSAAPPKVQLITVEERGDEAAQLCAPTRRRPARQQLMVEERSSAVALACKRDR
eukprot:1157892-Pelagomonas_calceolata.AAC.2